MATTSKEHRENTIKKVAHVYGVSEGEAERLVSDVALTYSNSLTLDAARYFDISYGQFWDDVFHLCKE